jgi:hypothetical protein
MKKISLKPFMFPLVMIFCFLSGAFTYQWVADKLTLEDIRAATKVIAVDMTDEEIEGIQESLERKCGAFPNACQQRRAGVLYRP